MSGRDPLISIITATYNRSNVLAYAIETVLAQSYENWEYLIIGDACTDDTEKVVENFQDKRIAFVNLRENFGEQSGPNNYGVKISKGQFIAYLNHDDLWFPDHLEQALEAIKKSDADFVSNLTCAVDGEDRLNLIGLPQEKNPEPFYWTPASSWLVPRKVVDEVGPWRFYREIYAIPSQDWLFRVWKAGKKVYLNPELTVIAVQSGSRKGSYSQREYEVNKMYFDQLKSYQTLRALLLTTVAVSYSGIARNASLNQSIKRSLKNTIIKFIYKFGYNPYAFLYFVLYRKKGGFIDHLRKRRGLRKKR